MQTVLIAGVMAATVPAAQTAADLAGTWTLVAADLVRPDGTVVRDYGEAPKGRLFVDPAGHYALQIYKAERPVFAAPDKAAGAPQEYKAAVLGSSTHYGRIALEDGQLRFDIEGASFPNWENTVQRRSYELDGDVLRYRVPPRPDGGVPVSVWRRLR